jgi:hypothetical protein
LRRRQCLEGAVLGAEAGEGGGEEEEEEERAILEGEDAEEEAILLLLLKTASSDTVSPLLIKIFTQVKIKRSTK